MKISISNIAWDADCDAKVYLLMKKYGVEGLEIAPTRVFPISPYSRLQEARNWSQELKIQYGFSIPSIQSIWYGRHEKIFGSARERLVLLEYTKSAIDFAETIHCKNLVFGCPKNRKIFSNSDERIAIEFFKEISDYAVTKSTVVGMEANPPLYNTNYINDTKSAIELIGKIDSEGFKLNYDLGTVIQNKEDFSNIIGNVRLINHVHISEPCLVPLEKRKLHNELRDILVDEGYQGYVSIEMGRVEEVSILEETMHYIKEIFA